MLTNINLRAAIIYSFSIDCQEKSYIILALYRLYIFQLKYSDQCFIIRLEVPTKQYLTKSNNHVLFGPTNM